MMLSVLPSLVEPVVVDAVVAKFDLQVSVAERFDADGAPAGLVVGFTYATDIFDEVTVRGFADRFVRVLGTVCADPGVVVGDVEILDAPERAVLVPVRGPEPGPGRSLAEIFSSAVRVDAGAVAVVAGARSLTYSELAGC